MNTLVNALSISGTSTGLACSFAGGCLYEITAPGLSSMFKDNTKNSIEVCGKPCLYSDSDSTDNVVGCRLPMVSTLFSNTNFNIMLPSEDLKSHNHFGSNANFGKVFDNNNLNHANDASTTCFIGTSFSFGYVGLISSVRYFLKDIIRS